MLRSSNWWVFSLIAGQADDRRKYPHRAPDGQQARLAAGPKPEHRARVPASSPVLLALLAAVACGGGPGVNSPGEVAFDVEVLEAVEVGAEAIEPAAELAEPALDLPEVPEELEEVEAPSPDEPAHEAVEERPEQSEPEWEAAPEALDTLTEEAGPPPCDPDAPEECNGLDDDCDGLTDEDQGGPWCARYLGIDAALGSLNPQELRGLLHALVSDGSMAFPYTGYNNVRIRMYTAGNGIEADASGQVKCVYTGRSAVMVVSGSTVGADYSTCRLGDGLTPCANCPAGGEPLCGFNTEHAWPRSFLKASLGEGTPEYSAAEADMHHLFPAWYQANIHRSNRNFGPTDCVVGGEPACKWPDEPPDEPSHLGPCTLADYPDASVFQPRVERRGDVARAWLYLAVRYGMPIDDRLEAVLRAWHEADPPDQRELDRNAGVDQQQRNRNPFVDRPGYSQYLPDL